ncbi:MAG: hypothetical protein AAGG11_23540 [Pseudomonadota bacterium]
MSKRVLVVLAAAGALLLGSLAAAAPAPQRSIAITLDREAISEPVTGRLLLVFAGSAEPEPRFQVAPGVDAVQVFGMDVTDLAPGASVTLDATTFGYPYESLDDLPPGDYVAQVVLHRYDEFTLANGKTVQLPMDQGEGQQWESSPGNLLSRPFAVTLGAGASLIELTLNDQMPEITPPKDTEFVKHIRIRSPRLSEFWGRDMYLGAHILLPAGFEDHPDARYPLAVFHGHFPKDFQGFQTEPPPEDLNCVPLERYDVPCYNRIRQQEAYDFYQRWISPDFPRFIIIQIQHANPYYDDSYAVNSENLGPYGDAINYELIPYIEETFRGIGEGWARFTYGGSTGGWEAFATQVFYPDMYNGAFASCPDSLDFRAFSIVNIYDDDNAFYLDGPFRRVERPAYRDYLGEISVTMRDENHMERAIGAKSRSGGQWDIWEAVFSPMNEDGYPRRIWDKVTGDIDHEVAAHWRENYDLRYILERDWKTLGPKLEGKLHVYMGDMDNFHLNNAVYLLEEFLESTTAPYYGGEVIYGDRQEHCWNGDLDNPIWIGRLRYNTLYVDKMMARIKAAAPEGADLTSWRY